MAIVGENHSAEIFLPYFPIVCGEAHPLQSVGIFYGERPSDHLLSITILEFIFFIFCSQFIRFLLKPLRQPKVISEVLAAFLIGPSVFGQIENLFPNNAKYMINNIGTLGFMFFLFISGVQIDLSLIKNAGRENTYLALTTFIASMISAIAVAVCNKPSSDKGRGPRTMDEITAFAIYLARTSHPVIYIVLKELNLLSSEMGRKAVTIAIVGEAIGIIVVTIHETLHHAVEGRYIGAFSHLLSSITIAAFLLICVRRAMFWIINNTPKGKPVDQLYVVLILLSVMVMGLITDMFGLGIARGSFWLGLVIPSCPPLGTTIVERSMTIIMDVMMPFSFALIGLNMYTSAMVAYGWQHLSPFFTIVVVGYVTKFIATFLVSCHFGVHWKDSLALSLILNIRGQTELFFLVQWLQRMVIENPMFTLLVVFLLFVTGISTYFLTILYDPTTPYLVTKRRTIQHTPPGSELMVVVCIPDEGSVPAIINLIEISNPSPRNSLMIYAIHLIELIGLSVPFLKDHEELLDGLPSLLRDEHTKKIYNALKSYEARNGYVTFRLFTAMSPKRTMYQDICYLALIKITALIIIPLNKGEIEHRHGSELYQDGHMHSVSEKVLTHSPCSVAIFVRQGDDQKPGRRQSFNPLQQRFILLFLGGADAREALAYADRIVANPIVILKVIKFTPTQDDGDNIERKLDDGTLRWFWERNESNERVLYTEVLSKNGEDTLAVIQTLAEDKVDLWIVGRKQGINPVLLTGLLDWDIDQNDKKLGIIGEFLTSDDFGSEASVLIFHQQILRGHHSISS